MKYRALTATHIIHTNTHFIIISSLDNIIQSIIFCKCNFRISDSEHTIDSDDKSIDPETSWGLDPDGVKERVKENNKRLNESFDLVKNTQDSEKDESSLDL